MRSMAAALLVSASAVENLTSSSLSNLTMTDAQWVVDLAGLALDDDPTGLIIDLCEDAFGAIGKAFTHSRTIHIALHTPTALQRFDHWYDQAHDGVDFAWEHTTDGLGVVLHNDGPISGCVAFIQHGCGWGLYVSASNPLAGHNKVRIAYIPVFKGARGCNEIWDDMDHWGETEGHVTLDNHWNHYDNPSTISYTLQLPAECRAPSPPPPPPTRRRRTPPPPSPGCVCCWGDLCDHHDAWCDASASNCGACSGQWSSRNCGYCCWGDLCDHHDAWCDGSASNCGQCKGQWRNGYDAIPQNSTSTIQFV